MGKFPDWHFRTKKYSLKIQQLQACVPPGRPGLSLKSLADTLDCCSEALLSSSVAVCSLRECPRGYPWHFSLSVYPLSHPEFTRLRMVFLGILASTELAVTPALLVSVHKREKRLRISQHTNALPPGQRQTARHC